MLTHAAAIVASATLAACDRSPIVPTGDGAESVGPYHAYRFVHDASVAVVIERNADPYKFNVIVRKDGVQVERHEGLTDKTVGAIVSEHVRVEYIDPPSS